MRKSVALAGIAGDAGTDYIFPSRLPPPITGKHMVDIEMTAIKQIAAVLACVFIPLKDIVSREFDFFFGQAVKKAENNDPWHPDGERYGLKHPWFGIGEGKIPPTQKIMC